MTDKTFEFSFPEGTSMADKTFVFSLPTSSTPNRVTVEEHRAPTDESIRIYDEMRAKALASVESKMTVSDTGVELVLWRAVEDGNHSLKAKMQVGGHEVRTEINLLGPKTADEKVAYLAEKLGKEIALVALLPMLKREMFR